MAGDFVRQGQTRVEIGRVRSRAAARHEVRRFLRRLALLIALLTLLLAAGATSFALTEQVSFWRGFLWTLDTIATIGSIAQPEKLGGQITQVVLITLGLGTMFYVLVTVAELFVAGDLFGLVEARRMQRKISQFKGHYLICGFGRVGRQIARDLTEAGADFVVIDADPEVIDEIEVPNVEGRGSDDEVLQRAGIGQARAVIACIDSDAENIFVTLTARELRPDIQIVARAAEEASERKLIRAGASEVVSPYKVSGRTMANVALHEHAEGGDGAGAAKSR